METLKVIGGVLLFLVLFPVLSFFLGNFAASFLQW